MEWYIGMDVHAANCALPVTSEKGGKLKDLKV